MKRVLVIEDIKPKEIDKLLEIINSIHKNHDQGIIGWTCKTGGRLSV